MENKINKIQCKNKYIKNKLNTKKKTFKQHQLFNLFNKIIIIKNKKTTKNSIKKKFNYYKIKINSITKKKYKIFIINKN